MNWLLGGTAFLVMVAYLPLPPTFASSPRWAVLATALPLMLLSVRRLLRWTPAHWWLFLFVSYAVASYFWSDVPVEALAALCNLAIILLAFQVGVETERITPVFIGGALGLFASLVLVVLYRLGYEVDLYGVAPPGGMFGNKNLLGEAAALVLIGCVVTGLWVLAVIPAAIVLLCGNRGALCAVLLVVVLTMWRERHQFLAAVAVFAFVAITISAFFFFYHPSTNGITSEHQRVLIWLTTLGDLAWFGHGAGSFWTSSAQVTMGLGWRSLHAHNDLLEAVYDYGVGSFLLVPFVLSLHQRRIGLVLVGFIGLAFIQSPTSNPAAVFVAAVCAGWLARQRDQLFHSLGYGRDFGLYLSEPSTVPTRTMREVTGGRLDLSAGSQYSLASG